MRYPLVRHWLMENSRLEPSLLEGAGFESLVAERIAGAGGDEAAYIGALNRSSDEMDRLIAGIAVPETWLFRYPRSYDLLVEYLQRRLGAGVPRLQMLSIGCATGQEPYCMAMAALHAGWPANRVRVDAFDRNDNFLRVASAGEYGGSSIRTEIPLWAVPLLRRVGETIQIDPAVRELVRFTQADVTVPATFDGIAPCDVIFCRNVLIYFSQDARVSLTESICGVLVPGGLLFTGHAEQGIRSGSLLRPVLSPHAFALERVDPGSSERGQPARKVKSQTSEMKTRIAATTTGDKRAAARPVITQSAGEESLDDARDLADAGRIRDGERMVRSIIARQGPSAPALELLGMICMAANDAPGARRLFEQAVYLEPARSTSLLQLAILSERSGDGQRAAVLWDRARRASMSDQERRS